LPSGSTAVTPRCPEFELDQREEIISSSAATLKLLSGNRTGDGSKLRKWTSDPNFSQILSLLRDGGSRFFEAFR
jgi:hypothetical protein